MTREMIRSRLAAMAAYRYFSSNRHFIQGPPSDPNEGVAVSEVAGWIMTEWEKYDASHPRIISTVKTIEVSPRDAKVIGELVLKYLSVRVEHKRKRRGSA